MTARQRCALERAQLRLWREHGFDVPALLDLPLPAGYSADTASWLEYCPGPTLHQFVSDAAQPLAIDLDTQGLGDFLETPGLYRLCVALFEPGSNPNILAYCFWAGIESFRIG